MLAHAGAIINNPLPPPHTPTHTQGRKCLAQHQLGDSRRYVTSLKSFQHIRSLLLLLKLGEREEEDFFFFFISGIKGQRSGF